VTIVELLAVEGRRLKVRGLDLYNGTPVLDIKPYTFSRRVDNIRVPAWYQRLLERVRSVKPGVREL
jgi:tRNA (Thr-GGU) A37 N-methylase